MSRLTTGVPILDRRLGGGLPPGTLVALVAPPESQSELFLQAVCDSNEATYLTTLRPPDEVDRWLADAGVEDVAVERVDPESLASEPNRFLDDVPDDGVVVVDSFDAVESLDRDRQVGLLDELQATLASTGSIGMVHCLGGDSAGRTRTLARADVVCQVEVSKTSLSIDTRLYVTKFRGGSALTEPVKVKLTDQVSVDTSRDIA